MCLHPTFIENKAPKYSLLDALEISHMQLDAFTFIPIEKQHDNVIVIVDLHVFRFMVEVSLEIEVVDSQ